MITIKLFPSGLCKAKGDLIPGQKIVLVTPSGARYNICRLGEGLSVYRDKDLSSGAQRVV